MSTTVFRAGPNALVNRGGDDGQTDEPYPDEQTAFDGFAEFDADAYAQNREDNRHHHRRSQADDITENFFHANGLKG